MAHESRATCGPTPGASGGEWRQHGDSLHHRGGEGERTTRPRYGEVTTARWSGFTWLSLALLITVTAAGCDQSVNAARPVGPVEVDGPVAWYALDRPADPGHDRSGHRHDALPIGFVVERDVERGFVAQFDGGALIMPSLLTRDFTVAFWLKTDQEGPDVRNWTAGPRIIDSDVPGDNHLDFGVSVALDKLSFGVGNPSDSIADGTSLRSQRTVVDGTWHHVAVNRDGGSGTFQIFIDGALDAERQGLAGNLMIPPNTNLGDLGRTSPASPPLRCQLSDMRFYDRRLTPDGVAFLAGR